MRSSMRDQLDTVSRLLRSGEAFAVARVVATYGSAPRPPGAAMVVAADGSVSGSVSGGCVEGAVYEIAQDAIASGQASSHRFGISDDEAFAVGLTCGGTIEVLVQPFGGTVPWVLAPLEAAIADGRAAALATVVRHPRAELVGRHLVVEADAVHGHLGTDRLTDAVVDDGRGLLEAGATRTLTYDDGGGRIGDEVAVFVESFVRPPRMLVFGAVDFAAAVAHVGSFLGFHVTVCDARPVFATASRFPSADEVVVRWPHVYVQQEVEAGRVDPRTVVCVLTHDAKFDVPLLQTLLGLPDAVRPRYVGAMGSRRTHDDRVRRLREVGVAEDRLAALRSPIGLDLGARTPEETAISIVGEVVAERWGGQGVPLSTSGGAIHARPESVVDELGGRESG